MELGYPVAGIRDHESGHKRTTSIAANAHALAQYAALCQEQSLVPIVEREVLMDGSHSIERCEEVTGAALHAVFSALHDQRVWLRRMLLKPNMVVPGSDSGQRLVVGMFICGRARCFLSLRDTGWGNR